MNYKLLESGSIDGQMKGEWYYEILSLQSQNWTFLSACAQRFQLVCIPGPLLKAVFQSNNK